jgi:hypothetical protein
MGGNEMNVEDLELKSKGDSLLEQVGVVKEAAKALNDSTELSEDDDKEVAGWLTIIGKVLLSIFK